MIHSIFIKIGSLLVGLGMLFGAQASPSAQTFGAVNPVGATQFTLAGSGINSTQSTITLSSFTTPDGRPLVMSMFGTIGYGALEPQTTAKLEDITFTGINQNVNGTAVLTGVTRGNDFVTPYAASTTLAHSHAGGATFILTNTAGFYTQFASVNNAQTINGVWTFASTSPPQYDGNPNFNLLASTTFASIGYVASTSFAGVVNATASAKGIVQLATAAQTASSTAVGSTAANLVIPASVATDTPSANTSANASKVLVADLTGKLKQGWLNLTQLFTFTGGLTSSATTTLAGSNVASNAVVINTVPYQFPASQGAISSFLMNNGSGVLSWSTNIPKYNSTTSAAVGLATNGYATTTMISIPAGVLGSSSTITITGYGHQATGSTCQLTMQDPTGVLNNSVNLGSSNGWNFTFDALIMATSTPTGQRFLLKEVSFKSGTIQTGGSEADSYIFNWANGLNLQLSVQASGVALCQVDNALVTVSP